VHDSLKTNAQYGLAIESKSHVMPYIFYCKSYFTRNEKRNLTRRLKLIIIKWIWNYLSSINNFN